MGPLVSPLVSVVKLRARCPDTQMVPVDYQTFLHLTWQWENFPERKLINREAMKSPARVDELGMGRN